MSGTNMIEQFLHENISWRRLLDFFNQENSNLKNRLSKVVDNATDKKIISAAEHFQNEFILNDECIQDIRRDIKLQEKELQLTRIQKKTPDRKACKMQDKLRNEMVNLEKEFSKLKNDFNQHLLSIGE
jgi:hypothetical protein